MTCLTLIITEGIAHLSPSPYELHIDDPNYFDEVYSTGARLDKDEFFYRWTNTPLSIVSTVSHDLHKKRRRHMSPFFSESSVLRLEPVLQQKIKELCSVFQKHKDNGQPLDLSSLYRCLALDVITEYSFPQSYGFLQSPDLARGFFSTIRDFALFTIYHRHLPFILGFLPLIPRRVLKMIDPQILSVADFQRVSMNTERASEDPTALAFG